MDSAGNITNFDMFSLFSQLYVYLLSNLGFGFASVYTCPVMPNERLALTLKIKKAINEKSKLDRYVTHVCLSGMNSK